MVAHQEKRCGMKSIALGKEAYGLPKKGNTSVDELHSMNKNKQLYFKIKKNCMKR